MIGGGLPKARIISGNLNGGICSHIPFVRRGQAGRGGGGGGGG